MFEQLFAFSNYRFNPHAIPVVLAGALIFFIGVFILLQAKKTTKNAAFFLLSINLSLWLTTMGLVYCSNNPLTALLWYKHITFFGVVNIMPSIYLFSAATAGFLRKQRYWIFAGFVISDLFYILAVTTDKIITLPRPYFWGFYPHYEPLAFLFLLCYLVLFVASQFNLWLAYKHAEIPIKKTQILIMIVSYLIGVTASVDFVAKIWPVPLYPFGFISSFIFVCLVAYSVIKYKAFDIETVIHKTILWVLSFAIITIPIFLLHRWFFPYMRESVRLQSAFGVISLIIFALYLRLIQPSIDHIFQRRRADMDEISSRFIADLVHLKGVNNLVRFIEETIAGTMYPQWIDIFICNDEQKKYVIANKDAGEGGIAELAGENQFLKWLEKNNKIVHGQYIEIDPAYASIKKEAQDYFDLTESRMVIPLVLSDRLLGIINLGKKASLRRYSALDFHFLATLKNQSAIAISNSLIYQNIEEQVSRRTEELVAVQKQLIQAEKLATVGTLSGGVAHEINNPLTAILTSVQMLLALSGEDGARPDRESLELIEEATQRCRTIVQKLMAYAKKPLESGELSRIDLSDVLEKAISFLGYQLEQDDVKIITRVEDGDYPVMGNHNELEQVLTNVILNARDAIVPTKEKGAIHISLFKDGKRFKMEIRDEGKGISKDVMSKIFDPFFTTKDVGKGLGLGLSICQSIIEKHKGRITVESKTGKGAVFTIELPRHSQAAAPCHVPR